MASIEKLTLKKFIFLIYWQYTNYQSDAIKNGIVYFAVDENGKKISHPFKSSLFGKHAGSENIQALIEKSRVTMKNDPSKLILKRTIETVLSSSNSEAGFKTQLLEQGIASVIRKNDQGIIYGIKFIDHNSKLVWNGSQLGKELSANIFNNRCKDEIKQLSNSKKQSSYNEMSHIDITTTKMQTRSNSDSLKNCNSNTIDFLSIFFPNGQTEDLEELQFERRLKKKIRKSN